MLQHDAVITSDLHNEWILVYKESRPDLVRELLEMHGHQPRCGGKEGIILMEHPVGFGLIDQLYHPTPRAEAHRELKIILFGELLWQKEAIRDWHLAKGNEWLDILTTDPAMHHVSYSLARPCSKVASLSRDDARL
jgi:hypothetical protein